MLHHPPQRLRADLTFPHLDPALIDAAGRPGLNLLWGASTPTRSLLGLLTLVAARGQPTRTFDGGNCFDGYFVARLARRLDPDPYAVLDRIRLSRAFTCFQLAELVEKAPAERAPLFVLQLLDTFYDESVPLPEVERLLAGSLSHLKRLAQLGPVIVGAQEPRTLVKERWGLLDRLQSAADSAWLLRPPQPAPMLQPALFESDDES